MDDFHQLTLAEAIAISQNPYAIVIRSKKECGISGSGHVAALTNKFSQKTLPNTPKVVLNAIGGDTCSESMDICIVTEDDWPI